MLQDDESNAVTVFATTAKLYATKFDWIDNTTKDW